MSQRKVGLKESDYSGLVQNVNIATQNTTNLLSRVAKVQAKDRADSERAIQIGTQTTEALIKEFGDQLVPLEANMDAALKEAIREQAVIIGEAKAKASKPGATKADRDALAIAQTNGRSNLRTLGTWVVNSAAEQNIYALHQQSVATGSTVNRLDNEALLDNDKVNFSTRMASGLIDSVKISMKTGSPVITAGYYASEADRDAGNITDLTARDLGADIKAFNLTGTNLASHVITKEESLTSKEGFQKLDDLVKGFGVFTPTVSIEQNWDRNTNSKTSKKVSKANDIYTKLITNHKDVLLSQTTLNFGKDWDQLNMLKMLPPDSKFKGINWSTFNNEDAKAGADALNKLSAKEMPDKDPLKDGIQTSVDEERYLELRGEMRNEGADGLARLIQMKRGNPTDTIINEQEIQGFYKKDGKFTPGGIQSLNKKFADNYKPAYKEVTRTYNNGFEDFVAMVIKNKKLYGVENKTLKTGKQMIDLIKEKYKADGSGRRTVNGKEEKFVTDEDITNFLGDQVQEEVLYSYSGVGLEDMKKMEVFANPAFMSFEEDGNGNNVLSPDGKQYVFSMLNVTPYEAETFNDATSRSQLNLDFREYPILKMRL
mgnify:CR=1 FL=1|tara:strand:- start:9494 stop:11293 length:1800 start_codon:yes stop_codon:yes gene_type:complete